MIPMIDWARDLFPLCRSLTGDGVRETIQYFQKMNPELEPITFKTGDKVFDWEVPKEWAIRDAYLEHESGQRFAEFSKHNLHVVGYSTPMNTHMDKEELLEHLYTEPEQPDVIPYVTSYYKEHWGFCLSEKDKQALPEGRYKVVIDSELFDGQMDGAHAVLKGQSDQEILFSSYICHPSLANNELSGPVLLNAVMQYVKENFPDRHYSYRFVLVPETIGAVAYLSRYLEALKENVVCGYVLSCVGDDRAYSHVQSRFGDNLADHALACALKDLNNSTTYSFLERGSDERQYCAPGVDLPVCGFCRSKYLEYPEYHTSADNFDVVTQEGLQGALDVMTTIIDAFEAGLYPATSVLCEPQLGKRDLYPKISLKNADKDVRQRVDFLAYADGKTSLFDIANLIDQPLQDLLTEYNILRSHGLIKSAYSCD